MLKYTLGLMCGMSCLSMIACQGQKSIADVKDTNQATENSLNEALKEVTYSAAIFKSVQSIEIAPCGYKWREGVLGLPVTEEVERVEIGIRIGFADEQELKTFATSAMILGLHTQSNGNPVIICATKNGGAVPE